MDSPSENLAKTLTTLSKNPAVIWDRLMFPPLSKRVIEIYNNSKSYSGIFGPNPNTAIDKALLESPSLNNMWKKSSYQDYYGKQRFIKKLNLY